MTKALCYIRFTTIKKELQHSERIKTETEKRRERIDRAQEWGGERAADPGIWPGWPVGGRGAVAQVRRWRWRRGGPWPGSGTEAGGTMPGDVASREPELERDV